MTSETDGNEATGGVERRAHERHSMSLRALVDLDGRDARSARILDFCVGGLFLMVDGQDGDFLVMAARQIGRGDRLRVTFNADGDQGPEAHVVQVKVARLFLGGMGVAFDPPEASAIRALQRVAAQGREAGRARADGPASAEAGPILAALRRILDEWLRNTLGDTLKSASEALFVAARDAPNNALQTESMDAMKDVDRVASSVREAAAEIVLRAFDKLDSASVEKLDAPAGGRTEDGGLSLVDTASFDDWVTVKNMITRHEPDFREDAYALSRRLSAVSGKQVDEMANPVGVQQVGSAFNDALQNLGLPRAASKAIYAAFEQVVITQSLPALYASMNAELIERGILPTVERPKPGTPSRASRSRAHSSGEAPSAPCGPAEAPPAPIAPDWAPGAPPPQGVFHQQPAAASAPAPGTFPQHESTGYAPVPPGPQEGWQQAHPPATAPAADATTVAPQAPPAGAPAHQPTYQAPFQPAVSQVGMDRAYQAARSLMGLRRAVSQGGHIAPASAVDQASIAGAGVSPQLLNTLDQLQEATQSSATQTRGTMRLSQRLRAALQRDGVVLDPIESEAVDVLTSLIEAVIGDPLIQDNVKPRIQRMSVPLLKTALKDEGFFAEEAHPARQVVNRLGMLGLPEVLAEGEDGDSLQSAVDPLLERVISNREVGTSAFQQILPELDQLIERQNQRYSANVADIVETRDRQQQLLAQRRAGEAPPVRRVAPELEPWFQRTRRLKVGDAVTFNAASDDPEPRTLAWVSDDHETFVFADRNGRQSAALAQQELALELLRGSATVQNAAEVPAMDRGVFQMLHEIHSSLVEERGRDKVTGLMSQGTFEAQVDEAIARIAGRGAKHALLALNLDGFAAVNHSCGRDAGDSLLRKLSRLLQRQIGEQAHMCRAHADEFLILLEDQGFQEARRFAERQCRAIANSRVVFEGEQYPITASIGLVPLTRLGEDAHVMVARARAALATAKRRGGNQLRVFDPDEDEVVQQEQGIAGAEPEVAAAPPASGETKSLGDLLDAGELVLQRQQVVPTDEAGDGKPHFELLLAVRGVNGEARALSEGMLHGAERLAEVDRWVIRTGLEWMQANRREVIKSGGFAINLSGPALQDDGFLAYVVEQLTETSVPPAKVIFGVTESVAIDRLSSAVDFIRTMREYGCRFSIDEFGGGHATFSYLKTLPVDFVKVDAMFVRDLPESENDLAMVKSINEIAHLVGKQTIAESVSNEAALEQLREVGVDFVQGAVVSVPETLK